MTKEIIVLPLGSLQGGRGPESADILSQGLSLPQAIWAHQFVEPGLSPASNLTNWRMVGRQECDSEPSSSSSSLLLSSLELSDTTIYEP